LEKEISVVLPTYNESGSILKLIEAIHNNINGYKHEIIVVDDNSPDRTYNIVMNAGLTYVKPILRLNDKGFANSIRCGIENCKGDIIVIMDSDFNHQPKYLPFMIDSLKYYDCVSASRFVYGGSMQNRLRHILSWLFNIFVRIMTGGEVTDSLYGFISIKRDTIQKLNYDKIFWGYGDYCIRLLYYLQKNDIGILQFPAVNGVRIGGKGNSRFFKVFRQYFVEVIKLTYQIRIKKNV
jgi:dolichol-phosphate mannosyltransferase